MSFLSGLWRLEAEGRPALTHMSESPLLGGRSYDGARTAGREQLRASYVTLRGLYDTLLASQHPALHYSPVLNHSGRDARPQILPLNQFVRPQNYLGTF